MLYVIGADRPEVEGWVADAGLPRSVVAPLTPRAAQAIRGLRIERGEIVQLRGWSTSVPDSLYIPFCQALIPALWAGANLEVIPVADVSPLRPS